MKLIRGDAAAASLKLAADVGEQRAANLLIRGNARDNGNLMPTDHRFENWLNFAGSGRSPCRSLRSTGSS